jgi:hypothetical protein
MTLTRPITIALSLLWLPARLVEEGLHVLGAWPWASELSVHIEPDSGTAYSRVRFRDSTPRWAIQFAYALPELLAMIAAGGLVIVWVTSGPVWWPSTNSEWLLLAVVGAQYLAIALPSARDMDQTAEGQR